MDSVKQLEARVLALQLELRKAIEDYTAATQEPLIPWAPHPTDRQVENARVVSDRFKIIEKMPKNGVCVEVGTQTGLFAKEILERAQPRELHVIDVDYSRFRYDLLEGAIGDGILKTHEGPSADELAKFPTAFFDWIYIDADHSYEGVKADIEAAKRVLRPDGYLIFNDYTVWSPAEVWPYGILRAVHELWASEPWELVYFAIHGQGYHDVCLRRMA